MADDKARQADISRPAAVEAAKPGTVTAKDAPLPVDAPKLEMKAQAPRIDVASLIGPVKPAAEAKPEAPAEAARWRLPGSARIAAGIALATTIGVVAGAGTTFVLRHEAAATAAAATEARALQATVAQLENEITALRAGLSTSQRGTTAQLNKLVERLDRTEKAQAEPATKITRLSEAVDRLEKRQQQQSAALAAAATPPAALLDPDVTGSIVPHKEEARPPVAEGWRLRDFYSGRAVVESRNGMLFEVGPGSNLPGLGRVETIRRENGRIVVVARNGIITASSEPRRPPAPIPYRY
ncbi:MAG: hypothetical protein K2Z80_23730 [Xanthobacteraceae bacterium]|nr:hypothetical protein [Xanthobacteraceae bacterium]